MEIKIEIRLINLMLELKSMVSQMNEMTLEKLEDNPPRLYRLKMIKSLMKALHLDCSIEELYTGKFINESFKKHWEKVEKSISEFDSKMKIEPSKYDVYFDVNSAIYVYDSLLRYNIKTTELLTHNSGVLAASKNYRYPIMIINKLNRSVHKNLEVINQILGSFLNPNQLSYSNKELIDLYNFPDVDLPEIDIEWY